MEVLFKKRREKKMGQFFFKKQHFLKCCSEKPSVDLRNSTRPYRIIRKDYTRTCYSSVTEKQ